MDKQMEICHEAPFYTFRC
nr:hypothetical protein [Caldalkalibacillus thermarum]